MVKKDTSKIVEELKNTPRFNKFYDENKTYLVTRSLGEQLETLLKEKNLKKADVIKKSELSEGYAYQIFSGARMPERKKLLCLAFGMELTLEETQALLKCAGFPALYVKLPFDCIVIYGICKNKTVVETNGLLFEYGLETLG